MKPAVLFVDDEKSICNALKRTFRKSPYDIYAANSGADALSILEKERIDVVVSDQRMPGMNGTELLSIVKQQYPDVSRLMLSGYSDFDDVIGAINKANIFKFLTKPWDDEHLREAVNDALEVKKPVKKAGSKTNEPEPSLWQPISGRTGDNQARHREVIVNPPVILHPAFPDESDQFLKKQQQLEADINNDLLLMYNKRLKSPSSSTSNNISNTLQYWMMEWPRFANFHHQHIIDTARYAGFNRNLSTWYTLSCLDRIQSQSPRDPTPVVIDLFDGHLLHDYSLRTLLYTLLYSHPTLFRLDFELLDHPDMQCLIRELHDTQGLLILNIGKRIIDTNLLAETPISYIEMDGQTHIIRNTELTQKRKMIMEDAQKFSIKTILNGVNDTEQHQYAQDMQFDYYL